MLRLQGDQAVEVGERAGELLLRQRVHQVEVDVVEAGVARAGVRLHGLGGVVDAPQPLELSVVEALDAHRQPVHPRGAIAPEVTGLGGARIGFERDLDVLRKGQPAAHLLQQASDAAVGEQAGRAAPHEDRDQRPALPLGQLEIEITQQRVHIGVFRQRAAQRVGIEIAVRTFLHAPRKVHIEAQRNRRPPRAAVIGVLARRQRFARGLAGGVRSVAIHSSVSRSCASRDCVARARCEIRFLTEGSSSAELQP